MLDLETKVSAKPLGIFHPSCDLNKMIHECLMKVLPEDCHKRLSGRLYISVTRVSDGQNVLISEFDSKSDLIRVIDNSDLGYFPINS